MEKIIVNCINSYIREYNILSKDQFGFIKNRSTCTQLLSTLNDWMKAVSRNHRVDAVYIDFVKAFDSVCHTKLIAKLKLYGINYELLLWIKNYSSDRSQRVIVNNSISTSISVTSGVPQGSIIGPILFLLFINDIVSTLEDNCKIKLFADDCKFYGLYAPTRTNF